jgi:hypothetical protein
MSSVPTLFKPRGGISEQYYPILYYCFSEMLQKYEIISFSPVEREESIITSQLWRSAKLKAHVNCTKEERKGRRAE